MEYPQICRDNVNHRSPLILHCREQWKTKICAKPNGCFQIPASPQTSHSHKNVRQLSHWELNRDSVWQKTQLVTKYVPSYSLLCSLHKSIHRFSLSLIVSVKPQILAWLICRNRLQGFERYHFWIICHSLILISASWKFVICIHTCLGGTGKGHTYLVVTYF
jgi:hypothetical protein